MADLPPNQVRRSARTGNLLPSHLRLVKGLWRRSGPCCHSPYVAVQHEWRRCASVAQAQDEAGRAMDLVWSTVNWIDGWLGPYGTVAVVGGLIAGFLYWLLSASR